MLLPELLLVSYKMLKQLFLFSTTYFCSVLLSRTFGPLKPWISPTCITPGVSVNKNLYWTVNPGLRLSPLHCPWHFISLNIWFVFYVCDHNISYMAFWFYFHFTQHPHFSGIGFVFSELQFANSMFYECGCSFHSNIPENMMKESPKHLIRLGKNSSWGFNLYSWVKFV